MKFEPIETLPDACPLFVESAYKHLVDKLGVTAWHWHQPRTASELERFLIYGQSRSRFSDFYELINSHYSYHNVFDHAICFKGYAPFVLTMPYGDNVTFYEEFDKFTASYYAEKERVVYAADALGTKTYNTKSWNGQLHALPKFDATIVPNWYKVRENGDFAAIIAMDNWMHELSELGGFPLVNADGSER